LGRGLLAALLHQPVRVGLQLFSVRDLCAADLPGSLKQVAKLGFDGIEFAGYHGRSPQQLAAMLGDNGLVCAGAHVILDDFLLRFDATVAFHKAFGNRNLLVPGLPESYHADWRKTAQIFSEMSERLKPLGLRIGYHNHALEFRSMNGERPWDVFFGNTPADVIMQFDIGNAGYGGADPVAELRRYPGRARSVHVKDYTREKADVLIGDGLVNWPDLLRTCETVSGTEWYIVERDAKSFTEIAESRRRLLDLGR
jgi:sugar phosphate isomerase/epimerase